MISIERKKKCTNYNLKKMIQFEKNYQEKKCVDLGIKREMGGRGVF